MEAARTAPTTVVIRNGDSMHSGRLRATIYGGFTMIIYIDSKGTFEGLT